MGRGDKKTKKGKRKIGSFGKIRPAQTHPKPIDVIEVINGKLVITKKWKINTTKNFD